MNTIIGTQSRLISVWQEYGSFTSVKALMKYTRKLIHIETR